MTDTTTNPGSTNPGSSPSGTAEAPASAKFADSSAGNWISGLLLLGILFHLVYLTKDLGFRADLTEEGLYSLTPSTHKVLSSLEEPLIIEAYFSEKLPGYMKAGRDKILNLLDEYAQIGGGRVQVVRYDPLEDERVREKANNLGIQEFQLQAAENFTLSVQKVYQGIRLRYGGDRQKILPAVVDPDGLESELTPKIRELVLREKPKIALVSRSFQGMGFMGQQQQEPGFRFVEQGAPRIAPSLRDRFEVVSVDLSADELLPEDLDVLVLLQPLNLTDWEKYVIDQHVMRGGHLLVFQDLADYSIDQFSTYMKKQGSIDAAQSKVPWKQQLANYGIDMGDELIADWAGVMTAYVPMRSQIGTLAQPVKMPFWFTTEQIDWKEATKQGGGTEFDATVWSGFLPGMNQEHPVIEATPQLPFFWASKVGLTKELPEGVTGQVLARTSPFTISEAPMQASNPSSEGFLAQRRARLEKAPRVQFPVMALVKGEFPSAFAEREIPARPSDAAPADRNGGLQEQPAAPPPGAVQRAQPENVPQDPKGADAQEPKGADAQEPKGEPQVPEAGPPAGQDPQPSSEQPEAPQLPGPPMPESQEGPKEPEKEPLPAKITKGTSEARILVVGDASFVRDDFLQGIAPFGQPRSAPQGLQFFHNMLDWFALDTDLIELRNRRATERTLSFGEPNLESNESDAAFNERIAGTKRWVLGLNIVLPVLVLVLFGVIVWIVRSSQKNRFLDQVERQG